MTAQKVGVRKIIVTAHKVGGALKVFDCAKGGGCVKKM